MTKYLVLIMRLTVFIIVFVSIYNFAFCQSPKLDISSKDTLMSNISLKGQEAVTTIINRTNDKIKLRGRISFYLPISENIIEEDIDPGKSAIVKLKMNYADFIQFTSIPLSIYTLPGKNETCIIQNTKPLEVKFEGDLSVENKYYHEYFKVAKSNQVYYQAGGQVKDFNKFLELADSINNFNNRFLNTYKQPLPSSFKENEAARLMYNNAFLKHHVPFDLSFKSGQKIKLDKDYYAFDKEIPLTGRSISLSSEYLWYAVFRLRDKAINNNTPDSLLTLSMPAEAQKEYQDSEIGDAVKMRLLYNTYANSKNEYVRSLPKVTFANQANKKILDSVCIARFSYPLVGKKAPAFRLASINGDIVESSQFKDHLVIVNFWASWCSACIQEFPSENKLYDKYKASNKLVVINICIDTPPKTWQSLSSKHQLSMINLFADGAQTKQLKRKYNISSLPKSVLIDRNFDIINNNFKRASEVNQQDLE